MTTTANNTRLESDLAQRQGETADLATLFGLLLEELRANTAAVNRLVEAQQRERQASPWLDPEETAALLGFPTDTRTYLRKLARLVDRGFLTKVQEGRPRRYWREEVQEVAQRIAAGKISTVGVR